MPVTSYYTVGDEILGERTAGQPRLDYVPDALGSVVATVDQTKTVKSTARYKPYGDLLSGSGTQPSFGWIGTLGYNHGAGFPHLEEYVRARFYGTGEGRWATVDPLWPGEPAYSYASANPTSRVDPSGMGDVFGIGAPYNASIGNCGKKSEQAKWMWPSNVVSGWIVQKVTFTQGESNCGGEPAGNPICRPTSTYYERWLIRGNTLEYEVNDGMDGYAWPNDYYQLPGGALFTRGSQSLQAEAKLLGQKTGRLPGIRHFDNTPGHVDCAGVLATANANSTDDPFPNWEDMTRDIPTIHREPFVTMWDCCICFPFH